MKRFIIGWVLTAIGNMLAIGSFILLIVNAFATNVDAIPFESKTLWIALIIGVILAVTGFMMIARRIFKAFFG